MSKAWKELDLEGGGLQSVNARLAREMRTRPAAYAAWVLFPLGLHRFYLREPLGGAGFLLLGAATLASVLFAPASWWLVPLGIGVLWALVDLWWIDRRVTDYNKELRKQVFLRKGHKPPQDYRGRYTSDEDARRELDEYRQIKEAEKPGQSGLAGANDRDRDAGGKRRMPSFNEQEAMLRQMRKDRNEGDDKG
ncbi:TM2 domain-containing protein [Thioalkalivibrio sp. AKL19]|uniref:TM2 domain-containing protein n=1 Tax=Thioalkalivibrio sp. AKL19 TaxID=1266914 RepID=UPI0004019504|nr:TM2 domain-containing protein [Thioalkalivibrio sp. AKL19]